MCVMSNWYHPDQVNTRQCQVILAILCFRAYSIKGQILLVLVNLVYHLCS